MGLGLSTAPPADTASADPCRKKGSYTDTCIVKASTDDDDGKDDVEAPRGRSAGEAGPSIAELRKRAVAAGKAAARYQNQLASYNDCVWASHHPSSCAAPKPIGIEEVNFFELTGGTGRLLISPDRAGAIAVARLRLPLNPPKIGPDPGLNKWKMAAVGYPLWVWADGPTHLGPVSDSVGGLSVSLEAQLTKTVFRMGDGKSITCRGGGTPFKKGVKPNTPSPDCGYRYDKPSLPKGDYTVSAVSYWAVTWTINGTSGVVTVPRVASSPLPVGEVQVLVR